jgi:hypothetical protein
VGETIRRCFKTKPVPFSPDQLPFFRRKSLEFRPHSSSHRRFLTVSVAALLAFGLGSIGTPHTHAATITFGAAQTVSGDTDVFNVGAFSYGYSWSGTGGQTVNGVTFTKTSITSGTTPSGGNLGITGRTRRSTMEAP